MTMRVYVPATIAMLRSLVSEKALKAVNGTAFALTPALRESYAAGSDEELEFVAMGEAARASLRLIEPGTDEARRVVVAADVDDAELRPDLDVSVVRLSSPIPLDAVASVHVDAAEAEHAVQAAAGAVDAADLGDEDAELTVGDALDHELAWYAASEVPFLLELL